MTWKRSTAAFIVVFGVTYSPLQRSESAGQPESEPSGGILRQLESLESRQSQLELLNIPVGTILACSSGKEPPGYLIRDGREVSAQEYPELAAALSGWSDASSAAMIRIPDLRSEFLRGADDMKSAKGPRGEDPQREVGTSQAHAFEKHKHYVIDRYRVQGDAGALLRSTNNGVVAAYPYQVDQGAQSRQPPFYNGELKTDADGRKVEPRFMQTDTEGSSETRPRNVAVVYVIKAKTKV